MQKRSGLDVNNWKTFKSLLKQPLNRRCINCNSSGPQYVCLSFWTFVCTICAEIHRELDHGIKSVSMSRFTPEEIAALQRGGNEKAKVIYFKDWDFHKKPLPSSSNVKRLREVIRDVYVLNTFSGKSQPNHEGQVDLKESSEIHQPKFCRDLLTDEGSPRGKYDIQEGSNDWEKFSDDFEHDQKSHGKSFNEDEHKGDKRSCENLDDHHKDNPIKAFDKYPEVVYKNKDNDMSSPEQLIQYFDGLTLKGFNQVADGGADTDSSQELQSQSVGTLDFDCAKNEWFNSKALLDIITESETPGTAEWHTNPFEILSTNQSMPSSSVLTTFDVLSMPRAEVPQSGVPGGCDDQQAVFDGSGQGVETAFSPFLSPNYWNLGATSDSDSHYSIAVSKNPFCTRTANYSEKHHVTVQHETCNKDELPRVTPSTDGFQVLPTSSRCEMNVPNLSVQSGEVSDIRQQFSSIGFSLSGQVPPYSQQLVLRNPFDYPDEPSSVLNTNEFLCSPLSTAISAFNKGTVSMSGFGGPLGSLCVNQV